MITASELHHYSSLVFQRTARRVLHVLFPVQCRTCDRPLADDPVPFFCRTCWNSIQPLRGAACPRCARPFASPWALAYSPTHLCIECRMRKPAFTKAWAGYPYAPPLREAIGLLKYERKYGLADSLCRLLTAALPPALDVDLIMPVPLHPARLREREFNQSLLLAQSIGRHLRIPVSYADLLRIRDNPAQTSLPRSSRLTNLRRAFHVRRPENIRGRRVLLVDDVFTTGTTVNECAKALRKAGSGDVYVLTLARTVEAALLPDAMLPLPARGFIQTKGSPLDAHLRIPLSRLRRTQ
ncbi:MAG TPA: ComF family protein [Nitrospiraceae bacterium]|nr:ComF family protein [Nitrospiraceae bacterium]